MQVLGQILEEGLLEYTVPVSLRVKGGGMDGLYHVVFVKKLNRGIKFGAKLWSGSNAQTVFGNRNCHSEIML
jgi:hypothetical protein